MNNFPLLNPSMPKWKRALCVVLIVVTIGTGIFVVRFGSRAYRLKQSATAMKHIHNAFQHYADFNPGNYYPLRSAEPGIFLPDVAAWAEPGNGPPQFQEALKFFRSDDERPLCYLGYAFYDEASAQRLLDQLEKDPQAYRGGGSRLEKEPILDPHSPEFGELAPLRIGVGNRFLQAWYVLRGPGASGNQSDGSIPVLWQMPDDSGDRFPVLYLNGVVMLQKYPGEFPMTPLFINRLRGLMGLPQDPGFSMQTPILPVLREILETGSREPGPKVGTLGPFDAEPSVTQGDARGYRIALGSGEVVLFPEDSAPGPLDPATLFDAPKYFYQGLPWETAVRYMGTSRGYHWYGKLDYGVFTSLRDTFAFTGGESLYDAAVIYWLDKDPTELWLRPNKKVQGTPAEILQRPPSLVAYVHAYITEREGKRNPIAKELIHTTALLSGADYEGLDICALPDADLVSEAQDQLLSAAERDPEAVATLLLTHVMRYRARGGRDKATPERVDLLQRLPRETVLPIVKHLADYIKYENDAALCRDLLRKLD